MGKNPETRGFLGYWVPHTPTGSGSDDDGGSEAAGVLECWTLNAESLSPTSSINKATMIPRCLLHS